MAIEEADFYKIFTDEGSPHYNDLFLLNKERFNEWVSGSYVKIKSIESLSEVAPTSEVVNYFLNLGYCHRPSQCHYSSKAISLLDSEYEYWTGFVRNTDLIGDNIITHSFNICGGLIVDFARLNEDFAIIDDSYAYLPNVYFGIHIPTTFIEKFRIETFQYSMRPLICEWFIECECS